MPGLAKKGVGAATRRKLAKRWVKRRDKKLNSKERRQLAESKIDGPNNFEHQSDAITYYGADMGGNSIFITINRRHDERIELMLFFVLKDGKTYELPDHPSIVLDRVSGNDWSAGDLKLTILEKSTRARIVYNGFLRRGTRKNVTSSMEDDTEHVKLNFIFIAKTEPRSQESYWDRKFKSKTLANLSWKTSDWSKFWSGLEIDCVDQWGSMVGQIFIENSTPIELFLHSIRLYDTNVYFGLKKAVSITGFSPKGLHFHVILNSLDDGLRNMQIGHIKTGTDEFSNINKIQEDGLADLDLSNLQKKEFLIEFRVRKRIFRAVINLNVDSHRVLMGGDPWNSKYSFCSFDLDFLDCKGKGLIEVWEPLKEIGAPLFKHQVSLVRSISEVSALENNAKILTTSFNDEACRQEELVGGKGSSLAQLTALKSNKFTVPKGFCVTVNAYKEQMSSYKNLANAIDELIKVTWERNPETLKLSCEKVVDSFENTPVIEKVEKAILKAVRGLEFHKVDKKVRYAVRSSAVGEDNEESSAAGQNSTFLGVTDGQDVVRHVSKCWASLYSFRSVEYRRQNGLPIKADMGVVVQEMVAADAAGVMLTRHPISGSPREIYITSNYGLGESVVSALVDPDTIIVDRKLNLALEIKESTIGKKSEKIEMSDSGISTSKLTDSENRAQSISNEIALRLADIGSGIEKDFEGPRDVEWAVVRSDIFLLQCRPITSLMNFTEFELIHELGHGAATDSDMYIFSNVGEVLPLPISPLNLSTVVEAMNASMDTFMNYVKVDSFKIYRKYCFITHMRWTLNYINMFLPFVSKEPNLMISLGDIVSAGHPLVTDEIFRISVERNGVMSFKQSGILLKELLKRMKTINRRIAQSKKVIESHWKKFSDSEDLSTKDSYNQLNDLLLDICIFCLNHGYSSNVSGVSQMFAFKTLMEGEKEISPSHLVDMANILRSCNENVVSVEIPKAIKTIVQTIRDSGKKESFEAVDSSRMDWLKRNCPDVHEKVREFFKSHGHRAVMEFDVFTETWSMNSEKFLSTIQVMLKNDSGENVEVETKKPEPLVDVVNRLVTPKKSSTKWLLKKMLPMCQRNVARRELTKSLLIEMVHVVRLYCRQLEKSMMKDGYLPEEDLLFFLTYEEIGNILEKPNAALIRKAMQRRKVYDKLKSFEFEEINVGMPRPIQTSEEIQIGTDGVSIKGAPVYTGIIKSRACVAPNLEDANKILKGDILITKATDVGWSPFFPMLSGVVTELGGIMSHGAVIAREYGLPCIVAAKNATKLFKTGDLVVLDGTSGVISLVSNSEKNTSETSKLV